MSGTVGIHNDARRRDISPTPDDGVVTATEIMSAVRVGAFERTFEAELAARYDIAKLPDAHTGPPSSPSMRRTSRW